MWSIYYFIFITSSGFAIIIGLTEKYRLSGKPTIMKQNMIIWSGERIGHGYRLNNLNLATLNRN